MGLVYLEVSVGVVEAFAVGDHAQQVLEHGLVHVCVHPTGAQGR